VLPETPLNEEMQMMHMDFVEEAYWKRCAAKKFALECSQVALKKGKIRA